MGAFGSVNRFNHTSMVDVITPTDRSESIRNRFTCVFEVLEAFLCCRLSLWFIFIFCWYMGCCQRNGSNLSGRILCGCLIGSRGGLKVVLSYHYHFYNIHKVSVWKSYLFPSSKNMKWYILSQTIIRIQLTIPGFHESAFPLLVCLNLHDCTPFKPKTSPIKNTFYMPKHNYVTLFCVEKTPGEGIFMKVIVWKSRTNGL